ncbi:hypothetical protein Tco_0761405 [Tanacetum coccineum]
MERSATTASTLKQRRTSWYDKIGPNPWQHLMNLFLRIELITASTLENVDMEITVYRIDGRGEVSTVPVKSHYTPISAPSTSQPPTSPPSMQTTRVAEEAATMSYDSPLLRVHSLRSDEGSITLNELTVICKTLERKDKQCKEKYEWKDAFKQGEDCSDDEDEGISLVKMSAKLQAQERERYSEADKARLLVEIINERKRKLAQQRSKQRRNKPMNQAQQRTYMCNYIKNMGSHSLQQLKKLSFDEVKELFETTMKRVNTFTPMKSDDTIPKVVAGSSKIDTEQELNQESSKRQKIREGSEPAEESKDELSQEQLQQLMIIVPEEGMNVEALQTKYPIIDWEVYTEDSRNTVEDQEWDDLVKLWSLVHERFNSTEPTEDKERELWVELKRLFEPDDDDILWKLQRYMHDPLKWKLYDTCAIHHVSTKRGHDIFMLVEKDYPLTRALMTLMLSNKLQVDEYSVMADELLRKIFILANKPR